MHLVRSADSLAASCWRNQKAASRRLGWGFATIGKMNAIESSMLKREVNCEGVGQIQAVVGAMTADTSGLPIETKAVGLAYITLATAANGLVVLSGRNPTRSFLRKLGSLFVNTPHVRFRIPWAVFLENSYIHRIQPLNVAGRKGVLVDYQLPQEAARQLSATLIDGDVAGFVEHAMP